MKSQLVAVTCAVILTGCSSGDSDPVNPLAIVDDQVQQEQEAPPVTQPPVVTEPTPEPPMTEETETVELPVVETQPEPEPEVVAVAVEEAPTVVDPFTGDEITLSRAAFTADDFSLNGRMWECVDMEYGVRGDFWSFVPGSKGVMHHPDSTADLFENVNSSITTAGSGLPWSVDDGVYFGPLNLHGVKWLQGETINGAEIYYIWIDENNRRSCYERRE